MSRRERQKVLRVLAFALSVGSGCGAGKPPARIPVRGPLLRVLTYNVNFGRAGERDTIAAIHDAAVDLALLQETNQAWERWLRTTLSAEFPHMFFHNRGGGGGLAVLSRMPLVEVVLLRPPESGWFPAVRVVVETPLGKVQALGVHLHPPVSDAGSLIGGYFTTGGAGREEIEAFYARLVPGLPTLIAGDFNEDASGDVTKFLLAKGMTSAVAPNQPTWRWAAGVGTIERQLDHILYDSRFERVGGEVRVAGRSDHFPVIGTFQLVETRAAAGTPTR